MALLVEEGATPQNFIFAFFHLKLIFGTSSLPKKLEPKSDLFIQILVGRWVINNRNTS